MRARRTFLDRKNEIERVIGKLRNRPEFRQNIAFALVRIEAEGAMQGLDARFGNAQFGDIALQAVTSVHSLVQQRLQPHFTRCLQDIGKGGCDIHIATTMRGFEQLTPCFAHECCLHQVVHHLEMTGDIRLKRKLMQDGFAKRMDGLDFQAARRFQCAGEKPPCHRKARRARPATFKRFQPLGQFTIRQHRPFRQTRKHPVLHHGCRSLRIGEAEDFRGIGPFEQQADNTLGQNMRLARPGIGRHPDRGGGIGRPCLCVDGFRRDIKFLLHSPPSPPASPPADHSSTRAR